MKLEQRRQDEEKKIHSREKINMLRWAELLSKQGKSIKEKHNFVTSHMSLNKPNYSLFLQINIPP